LLRTRVLTGVVLAIIVAVSVLLLETWQASLVFGGFWLIGAGEWARLAGFARQGQLIYSALFAVIVSAVLLFGLSTIMQNLVLGAAAALWLFAFSFVLRYPSRLPRGSVTGSGLVVLAAAWVSFYTLHGNAANGPGLILTGLVIVWSADIGAYFVGRSLGRTPLAPRVSPKKTWEGVVGGVLAASIIGAIAARVLDLPLVLLVATAAAMALISVVGDLSVSMLKRSAGMKDSGVLLPGHGGVLDRFDGVTAALPFFVLGLQFAHVLD
jgi:phosphatidate cytidylyltransferase